MARTKYWQYLVNEEGQPIEDAEIYLYKADDPTEGAYIYTSETGGTATTTTSVSATILTDADGYFDFFVGGPVDSYGYAMSQKFNLGWYSAGGEEGEITDINIIDVGQVISEVDETDTDTTKNKLTSNYLEKTTTDHVSYVLPDTDGPHNIQPVDETDTDNVKNKTVSNYLISTLFTLALSAAAPAPSGNVTYYQETINVEGFGSGVEWTEVVSGTGGYRALISHYLSNEWPLVQMWKYDTSQVIQPKKIRKIDQHRTAVFIDDDIKVNTIIVG